MSFEESELGPTLVARVKTSTRITPETTDEVRQIVLHIDEPSFSYREGESVGVVVPGPHDFGNPYHLRRYSITNERSASSADGTDITLLVRRCFATDEVNGESYPGVASNYLCDAVEGDEITLTGPYSSPFKIPADSSANLVMIGAGTGIAPFRAFVQHIYGQRGGWEGNVRLFYGARTGMDMLYMNEHNSDLSNYYDEETFEAFKSMAPRPLMTDRDALEATIREHVQEAWELIQQPNTYLYLSGLTRVQGALDKVMIEAAGSEQAWADVKQKMISQGRWSQLLYS